MARQGNTPHSVTKFRESTADGRSFDKVKVVGGAAPESKTAAKAARDKVHGTKDVDNSFPARASNQPHTGTYEGPGQCESEGSRVGKTNHTSTEVGGYPQRNK